MARLCTHEPCACEPAPDLAYCSVACANADQATTDPMPPERSCPCGHDTCRPENASPDQPPPESQPRSPSDS